MKNFNNQFFSHNRATLRQQCQNDLPIVVAANGSLQRTGDSAFPFRQDSNFWYLTGINLPEAILVMTAKAEFLILPEREAYLDFFEGAIDIQQLQNISGVETVLANHEGWERLIQLIHRSLAVNVCLHKPYDQRHALFLNPSRSRLISQLKRVSSKIKLNDLRPILTHMRMVKQPAEIAAIEKAIAVTIDSFQQIFKGKWYAKNSNEASVNARLSYEFMSRGAVNAYPSIVAGGKRACTLHYSHNNQKINKSELLLVDAGAEYDMYAADITRVFAQSAMTAQQQAVYQAVKDVQQYAIELLKPGVYIKDVDQKVEKKIGQFLKKQKIISKQEPAQIRKYYPHAISHHLGLDVHDVADYSIPLMEGNVITVEPGIYIPEMGIGIRLEDDILITASGFRNLSADLPV